MRSKTLPADCGGAALLLRSTLMAVRPRTVRSTVPAVALAPEAERQRRSISQPRVARASGLPWDNAPHGPNPERVASQPVGDATLSGLAARGRPLTQGRRVCANPGLKDGIPLGFRGVLPRNLERIQ